MTPIPLLGVPTFRDGMYNGCMEIGTQQEDRVSSSSVKLVYWYGESNRGNCTIIALRPEYGEEDARLSFDDDVRNLREATDEDLEHFLAMGGIIR